MLNATPRASVDPKATSIAQGRLPAAMSLEPEQLAAIAKASLSEQQRRVMQLLSDGYSNKMIAWSLGIAASTAKAHVSAILSVYGCTNRTQAALLALRIRMGEEHSAPALTRDSEPARTDTPETAMPLMCARQLGLPSSAAAAKSEDR
jgi:DNA-binding CsgD family transcriptional regulator